MMKKICLIVLLFGSLLDLSAQRKQVVYKFEDVSISDSSNNSFFENHPKLGRVEVRYYDYKPVSLYFSRKVDSVERKNYISQFFIEESYDLGFVGDAYLFDSRHRTLIFPKIPNTVIDKMAQLPKCPQSTLASLSAFIYKDTVQYRIYQQCDTHGTGVSFMPVRGIGSPPIPKYYDHNFITGDTALKKAIQKNCNFSKKLGAMESTLVFWGNVSKLGVLDSLELKAGNRSAFSDCLKKQIEDPGNKWEAADVSGMHFDAYMRIYVKLNKDRTIDLVFGSKLLTANGR